MAYYRLGSGPPMLMVHGITTYSFLWRDVAPPLSENFDIVVVDLLGCGDSDKPAGADLSLAAQTGLLVELLEKLGIEAAHLVTHDVGGGIGQIMTVKHPELVLSLALSNTVGYNFWPVQPIISLRIPILRQLALAAMDKGFFEILIRNGFYHKEKVTEELVSLYRRPLIIQQGRSAFLQFAKSLDNRNLMDLADKIRLIEKPVMIVRGETDVYLKPIISERLHEEIAGSTYRVIPTAGHFTPLDEPETLVRMIRAFIL